MRRARLERRSAGRWELASATVFPKIRSGGKVMLGSQGLNEGGAGNQRGNETLRVLPVGKVCGDD